MNELVWEDGLLFVTVTTRYGTIANGILDSIRVNGSRL